MTYPETLKATNAGCVFRTVVAVGRGGGIVCKGPLSDSSNRPHRMYTYLPLVPRGHRPRTSL